MTAGQGERLAVIIVPLQVALAALAWRDLAGRTDDRIRGRRRVWQASVLLHPGNSVLYWLFGRRPA